MIDSLAGCRVGARTIDPALLIHGLEQRTPLPPKKNARTPEACAHVYELRALHLAVKRGW